MTAREPRRASRSPLLGAAARAACRDVPPPTAHTRDELDALLAALAQAEPAVTTVAVGHSRDEASRAAATAFRTAWQDRGGQIAAVVDWPEAAASWLRQATRLTAAGPDAWVIAASAPGFAQLARRLRQSTDWDPRRTYAFASLRDVGLADIAGAQTVHGLRGAGADGSTWQLDEDDFVSRARRREH
jgi:hypothetical protein